MGLTEVQDVPRDAEHDPDADMRLPDGRLVQQFRTDDGQVYERVTAPVGPVKVVKNYRLDPDRAAKTTLCAAPHPMHAQQVRCEEPKGHAHQHFNSFFMRAWESDR